MNTSPAVRIADLTYYYKSDWLFKNIYALKDLSLDISEGESFGFLGPNGAGKTTTIKCILGLIRPRKGKISILGKDSKNPESRKYVGYLPEQPYFYDHLSVQEIMEMYACLSGVERSNIKTYVNEALSKVRLDDRKKFPMRTLSKGLTQRVALAQAIVAKPKILILDEPFSGLDPIGRKEFRDIILEQKSLGTTILMSSHILNDVEFLCSRASIMIKGNLKGVFDLNNIRNKDTGKYELIAQIPAQESISQESKFTELADSIHKEGDLIRIVLSNYENADAAIKKCQAGDIRIQSFQPLHQNLEDIFVDIVKSENN